MKKLFLMLTLVAVGVGATQCTKANQPKSLVTYFSASGVTRAAAVQLAEIIDADVWEIVPVESYTDADLDWRDSLSRSSLEMRNLDSRPAIKTTIENLDDYDTIYIGFPIWWNLAPTIINTFIESNDLSGKKVVLFATSGGSSIDNSSRELQAAYPDLTWGESRLLNEINPAEIELWVK